MKPLILDSALGTELENRGEYLPSFKTSIWSAYSLIHNPEIIKQIHIDNIEAGADVITTSNYQATPELLKREPTSPPYEDLAKRSLELCQEAIIKTGTKTKIAGCYPPIHVTFRPDLSSKEKKLRRFYETLGSIYQGIGPFCLAFTTLLLALRPHGTFQDPHSRPLDTFGRIGVIPDILTNT